MHAEKKYYLLLFTVNLFCSFVHQTYQIDANISTNKDEETNKTTTKINTQTQILINVKQANRKKS